MEQKISRTKEDYIKNLKVGALIAFKTNRMLSGKVLEVRDEDVKVECKNGSIYFVGKNAILWVKTGNRWPSGIFNALKNGIVE